MLGKSSNSLAAAKKEVLLYLEFDRQLLLRKCIEAHPEPWSDFDRSIYLEEIEGALTDCQDDLDRACKTWIVDEAASVLSSDSNGGSQAVSFRSSYA